MKSLPKFDSASLSVRAKKVRKKWSKFYKEAINAHLKNRSLRQIERFVFSWVAVFVLIVALLFSQMGALADHYMEPGPAPGGRYSEGMVSEVGSINPLFSDSRASDAASKLLFSGLVKTDTPEGLELDLAEDYSINEDRTVYTFQLRDDIYWHDGKPVTTDDVAFTIDLIQNPDVGSHLQVSWRDIEVEVIDERSVEFTLPNPYAPFMSQLTVGILPRHLLGEVEPERIRVASFNQDPVGSGPFKFNEISSQQIRLQANPAHHKGEPALESFTIATFETEEEMIAAYNRGELGAMLFSNSFETDSLANPDSSDVHRLNVAGQVFAFYNNEVLDNRNLRQALTQSINTRNLRNQMEEEYRFADSPLMPGQLGYQSSQLPYNIQAAKDKFAEAGWNLKDGRLIKDGEQLSLNLVTQDNYGYPRAAEILQRYWEQMGIDVSLTVESGVDLQENYLRPRNFDVLLYGIGMDRDPDVYAYWHSSQVRDPGRNVAQYQSEAADISLEDGRTRIDENVRVAKYAAFQEEWRRDAPSAALYRLHAYYVHREQLRGLELDHAIQPIERFHNVTDWTINSQPVLQRLQP